ncbi:heme biosynthesis protein HemY [Legionella sp. W05-934-2]|jgi:HemY protein|uniref:heme biosynthesis protein HemY n=1 Tax=Legionella sp. W05-934-2 TaxID=1198649 RepID=UPI00346299A9
MFRALFLFILLAGSVFLGIQLQHDPGYILIAVNKITVETTLWVGIFALILAFVLIYALIQILGSLYRSPRHFRRWRKKRHIAIARRMTRKGLIEFSEGYWQEAKKHLLKALPYSDTPLINYLIAARAAQEMGDYTLRDHYLREAQHSMPETKIAVELTQAQLQLANKQWEQALATLRHLQDLAPKHPYVLKLLAKLYEAVKDWPQLIQLLPELKKHQVVSKDQYDTLLIQSYLQQFRILIAQRSYEDVLDFKNNLPKILRFNPSFIAESAHFYLKHQQPERAAAIVQKGLSKYVNEKLIHLYGDIPATENSLKFAESLLQKNPHSAALLLCCGKICLQLELWGKAKKYLQQSIDITPSKEAYWQLGCLLETLQQDEEAVLLFKKGYAL